VIDPQEGMPMSKSTNPVRGSILLTTIGFIIAIALVAYAVLQLSVESYKASQRNQYLARAKAVADSELDYVYFRIKTASMGSTPGSSSGTAPNGAPLDAVISALAFNNDAVLNICDAPALTTDVPTSTYPPFCLAFQNTPEHWLIRRSIHQDIAPVSGGQTGAVATYTYYSVKIEVLAGHTDLGQPPLVVGPVDLRVGRRMNTSTSNVLQYNIFAQGDLEFAPGGTVKLKGDIAANGNVYMGPQLNPPGTLEIDADVHYLAGDNFYTGTLKNGNPIGLPTWADSQANQVSEMSEPQNLIGGLSAANIAEKYGIAYLDTEKTISNPDNTGLFGAISTDSTNTPIGLSLANAENLVYRSVTAPPPEAVRNASGTDYTAEYPGVTPTEMASITDDPDVAPLRTYNRASLIVTVLPGTTPTVTVEAVNSDGTKTDVTSLYGPALSQTSMYDLREQKIVAITDVDVSKLVAPLTPGTTASGSNPSGWTFNGLLYVYLANSSPASPAAVRLNNGQTTPGTLKSDGSPSLAGFSVATNGGLYVKGSYNTTTSDGQGLTDGSNVNPAMLMADAVTVLSSSWNDAIVTPQIGDSPTTIANKENPTQTVNNRIAAGNTEIAAGILTGTITADTSGNYIYSGGGQNLVRFLEDWEASNVDIFGSIGRLFESTQFTAPFYSPTSTTYPNVYCVPALRTFTFNKSLPSKPPSGPPSVTNYDRGTVFTW
jgi:hypothetical protein